MDKGPHSDKFANVIMCLCLGGMYMPVSCFRAIGKLISVSELTENMTSAFGCYLFSVDQNKVLTNCKH